MDPCLCIVSGLIGPFPSKQKVGNFACRATRYAALHVTPGISYNDGIQTLMNTLSSIYPCQCACDWLVKRITDHLSQVGLSTLQTFDLNAARHTQKDYSCPHHGKDDCDCQMVVLLIYGCLPEPVTLVVHGNDGRTWVSFVGDWLPHLDPLIRVSIERALQP